MNVNGDVMTSSPAPMPSAIIAIIRVSVPLDAAMQYRVPAYFASTASSSATSGPMMNCPCSNTRASRASIDGLSLRYWVLRSMKSICVAHAANGR